MLRLRHTRDGPASNYDTGLPPERFKELALHCAHNDIRLIANATTSPGTIDLLELIDQEVPLPGVPGAGNQIVIGPGSPRSGRPKIKMRAKLKRRARQKQVTAGREALALRRDGLLVSI